MNLFQVLNKIYKYKKIKKWIFQIIILVVKKNKKKSKFNLKPKILKFFYRKIWKIKKKMIQYF